MKTWIYFKNLMVSFIKEKWNRYFPPPAPLDVGGGC